MLKTGFKKQFKGKCRIDLLDTTTKMMVTEIISSTAIATIATKRVIKKLTAEPNSGIMQTM